MLYGFSYWNEEIKYIENACIEDMPANMNGSEIIFARYCAMQCRLAMKWNNKWARDAIRNAYKARQTKKGK